MKTYGYILLLPLLLLTGCTLSEKSDVEVNKKPTLLMDIPADGKILTLDILIYDQQEYYFNKVRIENGAIVSSDVTKTKAGELVETTLRTKADGGFELLSGVPQGKYQVISYANLSRATLPDLVQGVSRMSELSVGLDHLAAYTQTDSVYHSIDAFTVKRGEPVKGVMNLTPKYYHVDLTIQSEAENTIPITAYAVRFERVPGTYDYQGTVRGETLCTFTPQLTMDEPNYRSTSKFPLHRFTDDHGVNMVVVRNGIDIGTIPVSPADCGVNPADTGEVTLTVQVNIEADKVLIGINEWDTVIENPVDVGE